MPRIPQIIAESDIYTGSTGPQASPLAFSGGAQGLEDIGQSVAGAGATLGQIAAKMKQDDDNRWVQSATAQYQKEATNFLYDPANYNREDYADIADKFLTEQQAKYAKVAPSGRAGKLFSTFAANHYNSSRDSVLRRTNAVKLERAQAELEVNVNSIMGAFRQQATSGDAIGAARQAEAARQLQHDMLEQTYGVMSPAVEKGYREFIDKSFVIGAAEHNPDYARRVLSESKHIDESSRKTLENHIEQVETRGLKLARYDFERTLDRAINFGFSNESIIAPVPRETFTKLYGKEDGELAFRRFEDQRTESNTAISVVGGMRDKNAGSIAKQANDFEKTPVAPSLKNLVSRKADELIRQQTQDPAGYLAVNNDEVHSAFTAFQAASPEQQARAFQKYADVARKYQGYAPAGAKDADLYLGLPKNDQHILPATMANDWAGRMNKGSFQDKLQTMEQFGGLFENYDAWAMGFNDLVTIPKQGEGVKPQYQLALQFLHWKDGRAYFQQPEVVQSYLAAVDNAELLQEIGKNKEKLQDYKDALEGNPNWQNWARATLGDNWQRAPQVAAYKEGIIAYAWANGKTATEAVRGAVDTLIGRNQYVGEVNGQPLPMSRIRKDGAQRTEVESQDITRRLAVSLKYLDVDQVEKSSLAFLPFSGEGPEARLHTLRYIMAEGFFQPEPDGNAVTLYVNNSNGRPRQLVDKQGNPFRIHFDNLPGFTGTRTEKVGKIGPRGVVITSETKQVPVPETPTKSFSKDDGPMPTWQDDEQTHWPVRSWTIQQSEWGEFKKTFLKMTKEPPTDPDLPFQMMRDLYR